VLLKLHMHTWVGYNSYVTQLHLPAAEVVLHCSKRCRFSCHASKGLDGGAAY
jgi:hypothetical protein